MSCALDPSSLTVAAFAFFLAGFVKVVVGLGLPPVAMGLLSLVMVPTQAAALLVVPAFVTNVWQLAAGARFEALARRLWPMLAAPLTSAEGGHRPMADVCFPDYLLESGRTENHPSRSFASIYRAAQKRTL